MAARRTNGVVSNLSVRGTTTVALLIAFLVGVVLLIPPGSRAARTRLRVPAPRPDAKPIGVGPLVVDMSAPESSIDLTSARGRRLLLILSGTAEPTAGSRVTLSLGRKNGRVVAPQPFVPADWTSPPVTSPVPIRTASATTSNAQSGWGDTWTSRRVSRRSSQRRRFFWTTPGRSASALPRDIPVEAELLVDGERVCVYQDRSRPATSSDRQRASDVVRLIDDGLLAEVEAELGPLTDLDDNGRLTVLVTPLLSELSKLGSTSAGRPVDGCVRRSDFDFSVPPPEGNLAEILYLSPEPTGSLDLRTLLAHELTHVAQFCRRVAEPERGAYAPQDDWISEGVAHRFELRLGGASNLRERTQAFLGDSAAAPLIVPDAASAGLYRHDGTRGAAADFFGFIESHFGRETLSQLLRNESTGVASVEQATRHGIDDLLRMWALDLATRPELASRPRRLRGPSVGRAGRVTLKGTGVAVVELTLPEGRGDLFLNVQRDDDSAPLVTLIPAP